MRPSLKIKITGVYVIAALFTLGFPSEHVQAQPTAAAPAPSGAPYPKVAAGAAADLAGLLNPEQAQELSALLKQIADQGIDLRVATIGSIKEYPQAPARDIEHFSEAVFAFNQIGGAAATSKGLLFLVAKRDGQARIELGVGYGEARNADVQKIMDSAIIPEFKQGNFGAGIISGVKALAKEFAGLK